MKSETQQARPANWSALLGMRDRAGRVVRLAAVIALLDIVASLLLSFVIPKTTFLRWYLDRSEPKVIATFFDGGGLLIPDPDTGWRNQPNYANGNWAVDHRGSRSTHRFPPDSQRDATVLFLGSSLINGGVNVRNEETISAYLEGPRLEVLNFGTMLYSIDQSLLAYRSRLSSYDADVLVVGIDASIAHLTNLYIPFRDRTETYMPFVKPMFERRNGELELVGVSPAHLLQHNRTKRALLDLTARHDASSINFELYRRLGVLPIANALNSGFQKALSAWRYLRPSRNAFALQLELMTMLVEEAAAHETRVLFVKFPTKREFDTGSLAAPLYIRPAASHDSALRASGHDILFARDVIKTTGRPAAEFFEGEFHFTAEMNELIARAIGPRLGFATSATSISQ